MPEAGSLDARSTFTLLRRRLGLILFVIALAVSTSAILSCLVFPKVYSASATLIVNRPETPLDYSALLLDRQLVETYTEIARSRSVAREVIDRLGLSLTWEEFQEKLEVEAVRDTLVLRVTVQDTDPALAVAMANAVAEALDSRVAGLMGVDNVAILDRAIFPPAAVRPRPLLNVALAFVLSAGGAAVLALVLGHLDDTVDTPEQVRDLVGLPVLAAVPLATRFTAGGRAAPGPAGPDGPQPPRAAGAGRVSARASRSR